MAAICIERYLRCGYKIDEKAKQRFYNGLLSHDYKTLKFLAAFQREAEVRERDLVP